MKCPECGDRLTCYKTVTKDDGAFRRHYRRCDNCGLLGHSDETLVVEVNGNARRSASVTDSVLEELVDYGVAESNARRVVDTFSPPTIRYYMDSMDYIREVWKDKGKPIKDAPGFLVWAIRSGYVVPEQTEAQADTWYTAEEFEKYFEH